VHAAIFLLRENDMSIARKSLRIVRSIARRIALKHQARQLRAQISQAYRELQHHRELRVYYEGECIPHLSMQLAEVQAQLRSLPRITSASLGNIDRRAA
jgi:hypothetical protein